MATEQRIRKFYTVAAGRDFSRDFLFRVTALNLLGIENKITESELIYAKAANLPGRTVTNVQVPYMGVNLNVPGGVTYPGSDSYSLTFFLDANSYLRNLFEQSSRALFDDSTSVGQYGTPTTEHYIELSQLNKDLEPVNTFKLIGASIRNVGDISYNMSGGTGQTVELPVTLAFHVYTQTLESTKA